LEKRDYVPQNYAEVIELAKAEALAEMKNSAEQAEEDKAVLSKQLDTEFLH
jgi:uncharacterized protein YbjQ (UPF0145 family)